MICCFFFPRVPLVEVLGDEAGVAVEAERELREVVAADGEASMKGSIHSIMIVVIIITIKAIVIIIIIIIIMIIAIIIVYIIIIVMIIAIMIIIIIKLRAPQAVGTSPNCL